MNDRTDHFDPYELATYALRSDRDALDRLAADLHETKGEMEYVTALWRAARTIMPADRELNRVDLVLDGLAIEFKVMHIPIVLHPTRKSRGFNDFTVGASGNGSKDLEALRSGEADLMIAIVPHFLDSPHRKYGATVNPESGAAHGFASREAMWSEVGSIAKQYAIDNQLRIENISTFTGEDPIHGRVECEVIAFALADS